MRHYSSNLDLNYPSNSDLVIILIEVSFKEPEQICLKGSLILADPSLTDPGFERSVLLLTNHKHDDGAAGFILNKPMGKKVSQDQSKMGLGPQVALLESSPFKGIWMGKEFKKDPISIASVYRKSGYLDDARDHLKNFISSHKILN